jgi:T5SS/PEP-CTERM-associated repeat protein
MTVSRVTAAALAATATLGAAATDFTWVNGGGGSFNLGSNWDLGTVPGAADTAIFEDVGAFTVTFGASTTNTLLQVKEGSPAFNLSGLTYSTQGVIVGDALTRVGSLSLTNGTFLVTLAGTPLQVRLGKDPGAQGTLAVGAGALLMSDDALLIGDGGMGAFNITGGGDAITVLANVGDDAGSTGSATVSGNGSSWTLEGGLSVGNDGMGTLTINLGGDVFCNTAARIGDNAGSNGTATLSGVGSTWSIAGPFEVGNAGSGTLTVSGGAALSGGASFVGRLPGASGNATVTGLGTAWLNTGEMVIGAGGTGSVTGSSNASISATSVKIGETASGTLALQSGADGSFALSSRVGDFAGSMGTVTVNGAGSTLTFNGTLFVGNLGTANVTVSGGGALSTPGAFVGDDPGSSGAITVTGNGSSWTATGGPFVGNGSSGTLSVLAGGDVTWGGIGRLGDDLGVTGTATVDGAGSTLTANAELIVGNDGNGVLNVTGAGLLDSTRVKIGDNPTGTGMVTVSGPGSAIVDSVEIVVGNGGAGTLSVSGGATVTSVLGKLGDNVGSTGTATVSGAGSAWTSTGALAVGNLGTGHLTVGTGATVGAASITVSAPSDVKGTGTLAGPVTNAGVVRPGLSVGTLSVSGSYVQSAGGRLEVELSCAGGDRLAVTGAATLAGTLSIVYPAGDEPFAGQQFTILTAASRSGTFTVSSPGAVTVQYQPAAVVVTVVDGPPGGPAGDLDGNGSIGFGDVLIVLSSWGACPGCPADLDGDMVVGFSDLLVILSTWGATGGGC